VHVGGGGLPAASGGKRGVHFADQDSGLGFRRVGFRVYPRSGHSMAADLELVVPSPNLQAAMMTALQPAMEE